MFYDIVKRKNTFLGYKNKKIKKSKNWHFSKGVSPWFWSKIDNFSIFFLLAKIFHEEMFHDSLERKNAFQGLNNINLIKSKNWDFWKGVIG